MMFNPMTAQIDISSEVFIICFNRVFDGNYSIGMGYVREIDYSLN